jgi:hypothetical protein
MGTCNAGISKRTSFSFVPEPEGTDCHAEAVVVPPNPMLQALSAMSLSRFRFEFLVDEGSGLSTWQEASAMLKHKFSVGASDGTHERTCIR